MRNSKIIGLIGIILGAFLGYFTDEIKLLVPLEFLSLILFLLIILFLNIPSFILRRYREWMRWRISVKVGVLNGLVKNNKPKNRCEETNYPFNDWNDALSSIKSGGKNKFKIYQICAKQMSEKYAIIINPFGEIFFDENRRRFITFEKILKFIENGGVFVCTGGIPFYYVWHEILGKRIDTTPKHVELIFGRLAQLRPYSDTLFTTEFGVEFNEDKKAKYKVHQKTEDTKLFGDLVLEGGSDVIQEFRSAPEVVTKARVFDINFRDDEGNEYSGVVLTKDPIGWMDWILWEKKLYQVSNFEDREDGYDFSYRVGYLAWLPE